MISAGRPMGNSSSQGQWITVPSCGTSRKVGHLQCFPIFHGSFVKEVLLENLAFTFSTFSVSDIRIFKLRGPRLSSILENEV